MGANSAERRRYEEPHMEEHIEALSAVATLNQGRDGQFVLLPGIVTLPQGEAEAYPERVVDQMWKRVDKRRGESDRARPVREEETGTGLWKETSGLDKAAEVAFPEEDERGAAVSTRRRVSALEKDGEYKGKQKHNC